MLRPVPWRLAKVVGQSRMALTVSRTDSYGARVDWNATATRGTAMNRLSALATALAVTLGWSGTAAAGPMLTGAATYDRPAGLYTYTYTLDDRTAPTGVDLVYIRIATHVYDLFHLNPVSGIGPSPFNYFNVAEGGGLFEAEFASGTFYEWDAWRSRPVSPGVYSGLSFVSRYGPGMDDAANYVLYSHELYRADGRGVVEYGRVVART